MKLQYLLPAAFALLVLSTCEKPERDNPFDEFNTLNPIDWAPSNLQIEDISITEKRLNWSYGDHNIEGFKIDRKKGDDPWQQAHATLPKEARSWNDTDITPDPSLEYSYRLYAFAGKNNSTQQTSSSNATIPPPTNLQIAVNSITSVTLTWQDNSEGEEGFKIDRKVGEGDWQVEFAGVSDNQTSFTDDNVSLADNIYSYRVYAYNGTWNSANAEATSLSSPTVTTGSITNITENSATGGGNVTSSGGATVTARGIAYSTSQDPTTSHNTVASGSGTGSFTANMSGLTLNTTYYVRAYATNIAGTEYGNQESFSTSLPDEFACGDDVTFSYRGQSVTYGTVEGQNGTCWLDRNIGASRVATAYNDSVAYGDLFQWGRGDDGHQLRTSGTTSTLSTTDNPGHGYFITDSPDPFDWRSPQNDNLWQGDSGINDICPAGWRVPTEAELNNERLSWSINDYYGGFASPLKLVAGGSRSEFGSLGVVGYDGSYWSSSVSGSLALALYFTSSWANVGISYRVYGNSVRCIWDN